MSKIHSSIQKAIEKSRQSESAQPRVPRNLASSVAGEAVQSEEAEKFHGAVSNEIEKSGTGIFRIFQSVRTDKEVMEESLLVSEVEDRAATAAYKVLRTRVLQRMRSNNWRSLLVTSSGPGEGKTLTASNLALSLSRDVNQSVLLVDLDLQRSKVAEYFGITADITNGIGEFLKGSAEISDIVYSSPDLPRISIVPNHNLIADSSDLLSGPRMRQLLAWIEQQSDQTIVIFDMPPIMVDDDVLAFCPLVDAVLLVVAQGKTDRATLEKSMSLLAETHLLGVVLNKCTESGGENAYGYY